MIVLHSLPFTSVHLPWGRVNLVQPQQRTWLMLCVLSMANFPIYKLFCLPLTQQKLWLAMSFWSQAAGPFLSTEVLRIWSLSISWCSDPDLLYPGLLGPWADLKGAKCPHREIPRTFLNWHLHCSSLQVLLAVVKNRGGVGDGGTW